MTSNYESPLKHLSELDHDLELMEEEEETRPYDKPVPDFGEKFVHIRGYPEYDVSNMGRVYNTRTHNYVGAYSNGGYVSVTLYGNEGAKTYKVHQLVMLHFGPPCPDDCTEIDHINRLRDDNRIENLRWVSRSTNNKNRTSYNGRKVEYVPKLPVDAVPIEHYRNHSFNDLFYSPSTDEVYYYTGGDYRILVKQENQTNCVYVHAKDSVEIQRSIVIRKLRRQLDN